MAGERKGRIRIEEKLKRYEKIDFLGEGQFATVYKAMDVETKQIVAVKKDMTELPDYVSFKHLEGSPLRDLFPAASDDLLQLLGSLLTINPSKRCNCTQALKMNYFSNRPAPTPGPMLPLPPSIRDRKEQEKPSLKRKIIEESGFGGWYPLGRGRTPLHPQKLLTGVCGPCHMLLPGNSLPPGRGSEHSFGAHAGPVFPLHIPCQQPPTPWACKSHDNNLLKKSAI
ncbi:Cyclin-dependent kinase 7 [Portunus trituberculatus]|uniref:Cyclin-dependent kinase 7 n=1 Tax=Portunus trituberculatus TaxID=210409 RepID=A0A5B7EUW1_PORTR|nr:Cyclin-dependent kinase 7 [Portunus trituberculatus]